MHSRRKRVLIAGLSVVVMVVLSGCQDQQASPTAAPPSAPATKATTAATTQAVAPATSAAAATTAVPVPTAAPETFKVGMLHGITGPLAGSAGKAVKSMQMAIDDWNAKGGVKIGNKTFLAQGVVADDKTSSEGGREACDRLALAEKVKLIVGFSSSGALTTCQPIAEQAKVPIVTLGMGGTANLGPAHPLTMVVGSASLPRLIALQKWLVRTYPQVKRLAFLSADNAAARNDVAYLDPLAKDNGLTLLPVYFADGTKDFGPTVTRLLAEKPDALQLHGAVASSATQFMALSKALREQNWKGLTFSTYANPSMLQPDAGAEGFVFTIVMDYNTPLLPQVGKDLSNRFIQKYGREEYEESQFLPVYNTAWVPLQGIGKAGTIDDAAKLVDTLRAGQWDTTFGKAGFGGSKTYGLNAVLEMPIVLTKVQGGKFVSFEVVPGTLP